MQTTAYLGLATAEATGDGRFRKALYAAMDENIPFFVSQMIEQGLLVVMTKNKGLFRSAQRIRIGYLRQVRFLSVRCQDGNSSVETVATGGQMFTS